jgi:heme/copper-type cytochrome/quinol oxidase subunit 2
VKAYFNQVDTYDEFLCAKRLHSRKAERAESFTVKDVHSHEFASLRVEFPFDLLVFMFDKRVKVSLNEEFLNKFLYFPINTLLSPIKFSSISLVLDSKYDSFMIADNEIQSFQKRVLDTDAHLVLPALHAIKFLITAADVLHSFVILSTGIKVDAIVGRINDMTVYLLRAGLFYGQCSELCGSGHYGMPIVLECLNTYDFEGFNQEKV